MFGLEILDVVIGLMFVYLLLSLLASALNEYISAVFNLRGKELARGLGRLLDDVDEKGSVRLALDGVGKKITTRTALLTEQFYNHRLIRPYATRRGWFGRLLLRIRGKDEEPRLPSYIPARTFALALLDLLGVDEKNADLGRLFTPPAGTTPAQAVRDAEDAARAAAEHAQALEAAASKPQTDAARAALKRAADEKAAAASAMAIAEQQAKTARTRATELGTAEAAQAAVDAGQRAAAAAALAAVAGTLDHARERAADSRLMANRARLAQVLAIIKQESSLDLTEQLAALGGLPQAGQQLASTLQVQVAGLMAGAQTQLQKLHDGVEVWFNNSMDRVSGAYKRNVQGWLFAIGLLIALWMNADTIQMWGQLASNDKLRDAMAERAGRMLPELEPRVDSLRTQVASSTPAPQTQDGAQAASGDTVTRPGTIPNDTSTGARGTTTASVADSLRRDSIAWARFERTRSYLDSMELKLGWTRADLQAIGLVDAARARRDSLTRVQRDSLTRVQRDSRRKERSDSIRKANAARAASARDSAALARLRLDSIAAIQTDSIAASAARKSSWKDGFRARALVTAPFTHAGPFWTKLVGLLLTALALSLGAPFWFDLLNKVISIRAAGRAPDEKPKSPQGPSKRLAEDTPK